MSNVDPKHLYVTLLSNTSKNLYPDNTIAAFTVKLARPVELGFSDIWEVGVCEFSYPPNSVGTFKHTTVVGDTTGLIYCDLISPQYVGRALVHFMRTFIHLSLSGQHMFNVNYLPVETRTFKSIRIEILQLIVKPVESRTSTTPSKVVSLSSFPYILCLWILSRGTNFTRRVTAAAAASKARRHRTDLRGSTLSSAGLRDR